MDQLLSWLAELTDAQVEPGAELSIELAGFPAGGRGLLIVVGALLALLLVVAAYRRDADRLSAGRRWLLTLLRAAAVLLALVLLLDPQLVALRRETQPGHTLLLLDLSQSMGQHDAFERPEIAELTAAWQELAETAPGELTRLQLLQRLLTDEDLDLIERLRQRNRVLVYGLGATAEPLAVLDRIDAEPAFGAAATPTGDADTVASAQRFDPADLRADGAWTNLGGALRTALSRSGSAEVAGVVLLSDGRRNLGPQGPETARILRNRGIPTTVVLPIGDPSPVRTLRIERIEAPEKVFQRDPFQISAVIEGDGYQDTEFEVRLLRTPAGGEGPAETVQSQTVRVGLEPDQPGAATARVEFDDLRSMQEGVAEWTVEIVPPRFEARSAERHVRTARIEVLGEQVRALLLAGGPSHEFRILRNLLVRDDTIEVAGWLQSADKSFPQDGDISLQELPTEAEELAEYDVFLMLDPDPARLPDGFAAAVADRVREHGAGLWWVCGEKYTLQALREDATTTPLAELLPVEFDLSTVETSFGLARGMKFAWPWLLTPVGRTHKATRIADDRDSSAALWPQLPGFYFVFPVDGPRPAAQVLVEHQRPLEDGTTGRRRPLIATQFVGAGRVLFTATDDSYRWRQTQEAAYDRYWVKGIRYLFEGRLGAGSALVRLEVDEPRVELGQAQRIVAEARTPAFEPRLDARLTATVTDATGARSEVELQPVEGAPGRYEAWFRPGGSGAHRVAVDLDEVGAATPADTRAGLLFDVVPAAIEKAGPTDLLELGAIAAAPGGVLVDRPDQLREALDRIQSASRIESFTSARTLWDSWFTVSLLTMVLGLEWWLRKRSNLL